MCWWHVVDYPCKSFDNCRSQELAFRRAVMGYESFRLVVCFSKLYHFRICNNPVFMKENVILHLPQGFPYAHLHRAHLRF